MKTSDFKIIIKAKKVPINIDNEIIEYIQDDSRKNNHLYCEIFFQDTLIAKGIILDFYKEFEILQFNNNIFTQIKTFEWNNIIYTKNTYFGQKIFEIKNFKNPALESKKRELYINEIVSIFDGYIKFLKKDYNKLQLTFIPSDSKIPNDITIKLSEINELSLSEIIKKNSLIQSKTLTTLATQTFNKYSIDLSQSNTNDNFILIDDVVGTSASVCETMYKLYTFNKKVNFFFIPVKDVKR
jgi:hypothetical protein